MRPAESIMWESTTLQIGHMAKLIERENGWYVVPINGNGMERGPYASKREASQARQTDSLAD